MRVITIGRSPENNNIVVDDVNVSRNHLQLIQDDNGNYSVVDLDSTNGTYVNGMRITGEVPLRPGDQLIIGSTMLPWQSYFGGESIPMSDAGYSSAYGSPGAPKPNRTWLFILIGLIVLLLVGGGLGWKFYKDKQKEEALKEQRIKEEEEEEEARRKKQEEIQRTLIEDETARAEYEKSLIEQKNANLQKDLADKEQESKDNARVAEETKKQLEDKTKENTKLQKQIENLRSELNNNNSNKNKDNKKEEEKTTTQPTTPDVTKPDPNSQQQEDNSPVTDVKSQEPVTNSEVTGSDLEKKEQEEPKINPVKLDVAENDKEITEEPKPQDNAEEIQRVKDEFTRELNNLTIKDETKLRKFCKKIDLNDSGYDYFDGLKGLVQHHFECASPEEQKRMRDEIKLVKYY